MCFMEVVLLHLLWLKICVFITMQNLSWNWHYNPIEVLRAPPCGCSFLRKRLRTSSVTIGFDGPAVWTTTSSSEVMSHTPVMVLSPGQHSAEVTWCLSQQIEEILPSFLKSSSLWTHGFVNPRSWTFWVELWSCFMLGNQLQDHHGQRSLVLNTKKLLSPGRYCRPAGAEGQHVALNSQQETLNSGCASTRTDLLPQVERESRLWFESATPRLLRTTASAN